MSTQLTALGITLTEGYDASQLSGVARGADVFVVGNALSRGNPLVEAILDVGLPYQSGPQWLFDHVLHDKWVLAVAGTHGKTTATSMLTWILEHAGLNPGFLIGGVPLNFGISARLTDSAFFVIEADEYDTAFSTSAPSSSTTGRAPGYSTISNSILRRHLRGPRRHRDAIPSFRPLGAAVGPSHRERQAALGACCPAAPVRGRAFRGRGFPGHRCRSGRLSSASRFARLADR
jgi:hypothetical protein